MYDSWLNIYKPKGISSAKAVQLIKRCFKNYKIGHTGTLDLEAEGVLPIAIGQATKLASILTDSRKEYVFTIQFGAKTSTADGAGEIIERTDNIPTQYQCREICNKFIGNIQQTPPAYSAIKINGIRAYKLARKNKNFTIKRRGITIFDLKLLNYDSINKRASYLVECSKGTYIRSLAEDISLGLQSLGFVIELRRTRVGIFDEHNALNISPLLGFVNGYDEFYDFIKSKCLRLEIVLDDIPVLKVDEPIAKKVRYGQKCELTLEKDYDQIWLEYEGKVLAIGSLYQKNFKSSRVFNYKVI